MASTASCIVRSIEIKELIAKLGPKTLVVSSLGEPCFLFLITISVKSQEGKSGILSMNVKSSFSFV